MVGKRIRKWWSNLLVRVVLALVTVAIVPLAFLSLRLVDLNRDALETQVLQTHAVAVSSVSSQIEARIESWQAIADTLAIHPEMSADPRSAESIGLMQDLLATQRDLAGIVLTAVDGEEVLRLQKKGDAEAVTLMVEAVPDGPATLTVIDRVPWLVVNRPMPDSSVWVRFVVAASDLGDALDPEELGDDAAIVLVASDGTPLLGSLESEFPGALIDRATAGRVKGAARFDEQEQVVLGAWAPIPGTEWAVVTRQPSNVAERVALRMRDRAGAAIAIAAALVLILTLLAWAGVVRPIRRFLGAQRQLEGLPANDGGDIDQLKLALEALERRIQQKQAFNDVFLGRYQILDVLGEGGMGTVFRGWDPRLRREVALKTIHLGAQSGTKIETLPDAIHTLLGEAITVAKFNDPHIVSVFDVEHSEEAAFIAMELIEGESLEALLARQGTLPVPQAMTLALAVARGLRAAHANGVVHHDLKPPNILLSVGGGIKITDFGIAGLLSQMGRDAGTIYGTPGYLPPEAITDGEYGPVGDLFSLGVILYRCLSGRNPFLRSTVVDTLVATVREQAPDLPRVDVNMDGEIEAVVKGLMLKDPVLREITVGDLAERLESLVTSRGWRWSLAPRRGEPFSPPSGPQAAQYVETMSLEKRST